MSNRYIYKLMYWIGFTPWDTPDRPFPVVLRNVIEGLHALKPGRALDLGSGMGQYSIYLAAHGWKVTGIDSAGHALHIARQRAEKAGLDIGFVHGDVTRIEKTGVSGPFDFFLDAGCFHGMSDDERRRYGKSITGVAAPDAELLLFSFSPRMHLAPGPRGADMGEVERCFGDSWKIVWSMNDHDLPGMLADSYAYTAWYRLMRR